MRVKMLTTAAGPDGVWMAGQIVGLPDAVARHLVAGGYAVPVEVPQAEAATAGSPENAMIPAPKRRKAGK